MDVMFRGPGVSFAGGSNSPMLWLELLVVAIELFADGTEHPVLVIEAFDASVKLLIVAIELLVVAVGELVAETGSLVGSAELVPVDTAFSQLLTP